MTTVAVVCGLAIVAQVVIAATWIPRHENRAHQQWAQAATWAEQRYDLDLEPAQFAGAGDGSVLYHPAGGGWTVTVRITPGPTPETHQVILVDAIDREYPVVVH